MNIHTYEFITQSLKRFREILLFIHPRLDEVKLTVMHPPTQFGDLSTNALRFLDLNYGDFRYTQEEFIDTLKMFVPCESIEVVNGMLNVRFKTSDLIEVAKVIAQSKFNPL